MKRITIVIIIVLLLMPITVYAETEEEIMKTTKDTVNISEFIKQSEKYTGEFLEDYSTVQNQF